MFRPSASSTYSSAVSAMRTQKLPAACSSSGRMARASAPSTHTTVLFCLLIMACAPSGAVGDAFAQQAGRPQREHHDQHDEREDVGVVAAQDAAREHAQVAGA